MSKQEVGEVLRDVLRYFDLMGGAPTELRSRVAKAYREVMKLGVRK